MTTFDTSNYEVTERWDRIWNKYLYANANRSEVHTKDKCDQKLILKAEIEDASPHVKKRNAPGAENISIEQKKDILVWKW